MLNIKSNKFLIKVLLRREGKEVKIKKAIITRDEDRGTEYITYDTISTRALITNVSGYVEMIYPFGKAYEGDYMMLFSPDTDIDVKDRILYNDTEYKINELHNREDFIETVVEAI